MPSNDEVTAEETSRMAEPLTPEMTADNDVIPNASDSEPWEKQVEQMDNVDAPEVGAAIENLNAAAGKKDEPKTPKRQGLPRRNERQAPGPMPEQTAEKQDDATMSETAKKKTEVADRKSVV